MYMLSPEHRQREPNQTNETKMFSCPILHIYEWISWISSSFKGELRVHLCRGVFTWQWLSNVLFKEQGSIKVWPCLWKWIMWRTKEITEDLGNRVDVAHQARNGYKTISKEFGLHKSTVRQIVYKWPLLPSREEVDQQRSLQSRTCNSLRGCKGSQSNF